MYHPTTRLLTILELLQTHRHMSGEELASRLEVETRSVRRYILMLQELGMPIEGARGPGGGYRLRPGFQLPPLLFTEEEATALVLGLLGTPWLEIEFSAVAVEGALAKVSRVLPLGRRERLQAISASLLLSSQRHEGKPDVSLLIRFSEAIQQHRRVAIEYCSHHNQVTQRQIEPYSIAGSKGHWYVVGYCTLRQEYRLFRLDRMQSAELLPDIFSPATDFDYRAYVLERLATIPAQWTIEVEFQAELHIVKQKIPLTHGNLTTTPTGVLFQSHHNHLPTMARYLMGLDLPFTIHQPPELCDALAQLAEEMVQIARTSSRYCIHT
jgi:predicted DNA-binding transcriptional regulator YafY